MNSFKLFLLSILLSSPLYAANSTIITGVRGQVFVNDKPAVEGQKVPEKSLVKTNQGKATLLIGREIVMHLDKNTEANLEEIALSTSTTRAMIETSATRDVAQYDDREVEGGLDIPAKEDVQINLNFGRVRALVGKKKRGTKRDFKIKTRKVVMGVRGTHIVVDVPQDPAEPPRFMTLEGEAEVVRTVETTSASAQKKGSSNQQTQSQEQSSTQSSSSGAPGGEAKSESSSSGSPAQGESGQGESGQGESGQQVTEERITLTENQSFSDSGADTSSVQEVSGQEAADVADSIAPPPDVLLGSGDVADAIQEMETRTEQTTEKAESGETSDTSTATDSDALVEESVQEELEEAAVEEAIEDELDLAEDIFDPTDPVTNPEEPPLDPVADDPTDGNVDVDIVFDPN